MMPRVAVLFSQNASATRYLLKNDRWYGRRYEIVGAISNNKNSSFLKDSGSYRITARCLDFEEFKNAHKGLDSATLQRRYSERILDVCKQWRATHVIMCGFFVVVGDPLLSYYEDRIINIHPADLSILDDNGQRKYIGLNAVQKVMNDHLSKIRSTAHFATNDLGGGPIICFSQWLALDYRRDAKFNHERLKKFEGPMLAWALHHVIQNS